MTRTDLNTADLPRLNGIIEAPIFIVGSPRSGTTWLQRLLLSHPEICGGQESHFFSTLAGSTLRIYKDQRGSARKIGLPSYWTEDEIKAKLYALWFETMADLVAKSPNAKYLLEKTPTHARYMDVILEILPKARFVHIIRDSRSVVSSLLAASKQDWGKRWAPNNAREAAITWYLNTKAARESGQSLPPGKYHELRYEDLKNDTANKLKEVFAFLEIPISESQLEKIIADQDFDKQQKTGGSPIKLGGDHKEPEGFFRKGQMDSWKKDLSLYEKLVVWRFTRKLMKSCGYHTMHDLF